MLPLYPIFVAQTPNPASPVILKILPVVTTRAGCALATINPKAKRPFRLTRMSCLHPSYVQALDHHT